jgi:hypothetical protein
VVYGVKDGRITSAGYVIRQADLVAGKSFHGLTLRELEFPSAHYLTIDLIKIATDGSNQYLWLWHFLPQQDRVRPMRQAGELPSVTSLPRTFAVLRNEAYSNDFYPRMGRHHRDVSTPANRLQGATGADNRMGELNPRLHGSLRNEGSIASIPDSAFHHLLEVNPSLKCRS